MSQDRRFRRLQAKKHLRVFQGGKPSDVPLPPPGATARDRLGMAVQILVTQMRNQPERCDPAEEIKVLLQVAATFAAQLGADADQFAAVAGHAYVEYLEATATPPKGA